MCYVYVIVSEREERYVGFTSVDPRTRLDRHNAETHGRHVAVRGGWRTSKHLPTRQMREIERGS